MSWVTSHLMIFGSAARTLSTVDVDATRYILFGRRLAQPECPRPSHADRKAMK